MDAFARRVPRHGRILDAGAGTGIVGELLHDAGFEFLVAMDLSQGMLDEAAGKGVYKEFHRMAMGMPLDFPPRYFDGVISVGVFTVGHAPAGSFDELVRVTRPGGHIVFLASPGHLRAGRFQGEAVGAGSRGEMDAGGRGGEVPAHAQGGAGGPPPGVGVPGAVEKGLNPLMYGGRERYKDKKTGAIRRR